MCCLVGFNARLIRMKEVAVHKLSSGGAVPPPHAVEWGVSKATRQFVTVGEARSESTG